ncbi:MAG: hypothetical protein FWD17_04765 [Polyangiaceae bacterium]|nr:hypothetical protein [Polyangiaceae bacterium]
MRRPAGPFERLTIDDLTIRDERSLRHVALYAQLKEVVRRARHPFRALSPAGRTAREDRALFLNLTYWAPDAGGDVLAARSIDADVVAHVAWHHLATRALPASQGRPSAAALFLGEAIASAFDMYLVGRLLGHAPKSMFLETQVPAMAETARAAGVSKTEFTRMLGGIAADPDRAFAEMRELLWDAAMALHASRTSEEACGVLAAFDRHRFGRLLHRYELSNWVLYARAYARPGRGDRRPRDVDAALRAAKAPLDWLADRWVAPALAPR